MGTFVTAIIGGKTIDDAFAIPRHAMLQGDKVALVDDEQRLHLKVVEPIFGDEEFYYLAGGLEEGDEIIVSAMGVPIEGMRVSPDNRNGLADPVSDIKGDLSDEK